MDAKAVARACSALSDAGGAPFPEIVGKLLAANVERYHADLIRHEKTYYWPDGASDIVPNDAANTPPAQAFSAGGVIRAIRASQAGEITYKEFCRQILNAGCVGYHTHLLGKRVIYYGRTGENHTEWFPGAQP